MVGSGSTFLYNVVREILASDPRIPAVATGSGANGRALSSLSISAAGTRAIEVASTPAGSAIGVKGSKADGSPSVAAEPTDSAALPTIARVRQ